MASDRPSLFLVEHHYDQAADADLARMHRALTQAVERLIVSGVPPLRIVSAVFVPEQSRCLYVVEAAAAGQVVEATDTAGLLNGMVWPVVRLDDLSRRPNPAVAEKPHPTER
jgi:hypothetical protein